MQSTMKICSNQRLKLRTKTRGHPLYISNPVLDFLNVVGQEIIDKSQSESFQFTFNPLVDAR